VTFPLSFPSEAGIQTSLFAGQSVTAKSDWIPARAALGRNDELSEAVRLSSFWHPQSAMRNRQSAILLIPVPAALRQNE
jgi:hypothetical protein